MNDRLLILKAMLENNDAEIMDSWAKGFDNGNKELIKKYTRSETEDIYKLAIDQLLEDHQKATHKNHLSHFDHIPELIENFDDLVKIDIYFQFYKEVIKRLDCFNNGDELWIQYFIHKCDYLALNSYLNLMSGEITADSVFSNLWNSIGWSEIETFGDYPDCLCLRLCCTIIDNIQPSENIIKSYKHEKLKAICLTESNRIADSIGLKFIETSTALGWEIVSKSGNVITSENEINIPTVGTIVNKYVLLDQLGIIQFLKEKYGFENMKRNDKISLLAMILGVDNKGVHSIKGILNSPRPDDRNYPLKDKNIKTVWSDLAKVGISKPA